MNAVSAARSWLRETSAEVPEDLLARMEQAVTDVAADDDAMYSDAVKDDTGVARVLAVASIACLRDAVPDCDVRAAALPLLAADALMTAAFEAAAALDDPHAALETLRALCDEHDVHRIAARAGVPE